MRSSQELEMCGEPRGAIRVHGCMWCGEPGHASPECDGPTLPDDEIQMTLREFQRWKDKPKASWEKARTLDKVTRDTREQGGRLRNK